jgi:hypothetical protein
MTWQGRNGPRRGPDTDFYSLQFDRLSTDVLLDHPMA